MAITTPLMTTTANPGVNEPVAPCSEPTRLLSDHEREPERTPLERVFATHPPTDDRIKRVREAAKAQKTNLGPSR